MGLENSKGLGSDLNDGAPIFPAAQGQNPDTAVEAIEGALNDLQANKDSWVHLDTTQRIAILDEVREGLSQVKEQWIALAINAKGIPHGSFGEMEEWVVFAGLFRMVRVLRRSLVEIRRNGRPSIPGQIELRPDGQAVVPIFPQTFLDSIVYQGVRGETWMMPGISKEQIVADQAKSYRDPLGAGALVAVLGAGNLGLLPVGDFMSKLFIEKKVAILKVNPVNDYIGPLIETAFAALISRGYLSVIYGGSELGSYLCNHPLVDEIHMTGSDKTFEAILFGPGLEGASRKTNRLPIQKKPITGELGNVSPVIIVPGDWDEHDIKLQAIRLASWLAINAGCNCITPRVIIQHRNWKYRDLFVNAIGEALSMLPTRKAYYPGASTRHQSVLNAHPDAQLFGDESPDHLPWTFVTDVDPAASSDICFRVEAFYGQFCETSLEAPTIADFLYRAVEFANNTLWGNLAATLVIHPKSFQDSRVALAIEQAIAELRYGSICVNFYPGIAYTLRVSPHSAFPGNDISNIQSGIGAVNNFLMLETTQKSVFRAPFSSPREPFHFTTRNMGFGEKLARFEESPSIWNFSSLGIALLRC